MCCGLVLAAVLPWKPRALAACAQGSGFPLCASRDRAEQKCRKEEDGADFAVQVLIYLPPSSPNSLLSTLTEAQLWFQV